MFTPYLYKSNNVSKRYAYQQMRKQRTKGLRQGITGKLRIFSVTLQCVPGTKQGFFSVPTKHLDSNQKCFTLLRPSVLDLGKHNLGFDTRKPIFRVIRGLINPFVIRLFESIISKLATSKVFIFWLVSVAEGKCLSLPLS